MQTLDTLRPLTAHIRRILRGFVPARDDATCSLAFGFVTLTAQSANMESEARDGCSCPARLCVNLELRTGGPCGAALARSRTARQIDLSGRAVVFESLKERRRGVFRAVPVPPELLGTLDMVHGIREAQRVVSQFEI